MNARNEALTALLRRNGMYAPEIDLQTLSATLLGQMRLSFYGGESSIPIRPTNLPFPIAAPGKEPAAVALLDRRRLRTAAVHLSEAGWVCEAGESFDAPGADYPASLEELVFAVAELAAPLLAGCRSLVLCLDLPLTARGDGESELAALPPALALHGWEGRPIRALLRAELESRGLGAVPVFVCSAAAATLLDGPAAGAAAGRYLGLRWGAGLAAAFVAPKSAVVKLGSGASDLLLFEAALGGCTGVPFASPDLSMDRDSPAPGRDLLEKMVSAEELGERFRFTIIKAVEARLLTFMCGRDFLSLRSLSLEALLEFLNAPEGENRLARFCSHDENDRAVALAVGHAVLDRAARLVCGALLATAELVGAGRNGPALVSLSGEAAQTPLLRSKLGAQLEAAAAASGLSLRLGQTEAPAFFGASWSAGGRAAAG